MKTRTSLYLLLMLSLMLSACSSLPNTNSSGEQPTMETVPADTVITLERTACFGTCPIYTLKIYADGKVEYEGQDFVTVKGSQTGSITPEQVKELVDGFKNADYFNLKDDYTAPVTDLPTTISSITLDGKTKKISNYGNCSHGSAEKAPQALCDLEITIDKVTNSAQWTGKTE